MNIIISSSKQACGTDLGQRVNVFKLFKVLDLPLHLHISSFGVSWKIELLL